MIKGSIQKEDITIVKYICTQHYICTQLSFPDRSVGKESAMKKTPVRFLGQEDLLDKGQATHSCILGLPLWLNW